MAFMEHLKNFLDGVASAVIWGAHPRAYRIGADGFRQDRDKVNRDARRVGNDLKKSLERHGKQVTPSRG